MNEREFCYWLQGLLELSDVKILDEKQVQIIRDHLQLVFNKQTPFYFNPIVQQPLDQMPIGTDIQVTCAADGSWQSVRPPGSC